MMFDNIPKPVLNLLIQMLKNAAPELIPQLEQVADVVIAFKAQADRIEANQQLIMNHLGLTEHENGQSNSNGRQIVKRIERNPATP